MRYGKILALLFFSLVCTTNQALPTEFYSGKKITILVGFGPGGPVDQNGRLVAEFISRYIPGNPTVVVKNMPGAGSVVMTNYLFSAARRDGTVLGMHSNMLPIYQLIRSKGLRFDVRKFNYIGSVAPTVGFLFLRSDAGINIHQKTGGKEFPVAASGKGSPTYIFPTLLNKLFGYRVKPVLGYSGAAKSILAMEQGEVVGVVTGWTTIKTRRPTWVSSGFAVPVVQFSPKRIAELPYVPTLKETAKSEDQRKIADFFSIPSTLGRPFVAPPSVPMKQISVLRNAFDKVTRDMALLKKAEKQKISVDPIRGTDLKKAIGRVMDISPRLVKKIKKILAYN